MFFFPLAWSGYLTSGGALGLSRLRSPPGPGVTLGSGRMCPHGIWPATGALLLLVGVFFFLPAHEHVFIPLLLFYHQFPGAACFAWKENILIN